METEIRQSQGVLVVSLRGDWHLNESVQPFAETVQTHVEGGFRAIGFDAAELGTWDSSLLIFLLGAADYCDERDIAFQDDGLPENIQGLLALARAVPEKELGERSDPPTLSFRLGQAGIRAYDSVLEAVSFVGEVARGFFRLITFRLRLRWRDFWVVVQSNGWNALPIVTLISFLVGLIISFLGAVVLRRFGAGYYVSYLVGYGMLREMGALMTGIIMAGRTGASFAAELGSMKISEEIDAFKTLGVNPVEHLVLPRVLGLFLMMPLLTIYANFIGIIGGMLVAVALLDLSVTQFMGGLLAPVTLADGLLGVFKGTVFGLIIGLSGCLRGMQTGTDAGSVGKAATSAVVTGITLIIMANAVIDWLAALLEI